MSEKIGSFLLAVGCIILGAKIIKTSVFYNYRLRQVINVTGFNIPLGCALILFGAVLIYLQIRRRKGK